jgi:hypothetical protein
MTVATLSLWVRPYRLLKKTEAAHYCRLSVKNLETQCPVRPIKMPDGELLWDVQDLDKWIDSLKAGVGDDTADAILARLEGP